MYFAKLLASHDETLFKVLENYDVKHAKGLVVTLVENRSRYDLHQEQNLSPDEIAQQWEQEYRTKFIPDC